MRLAKDTANYTYKEAIILLSDGQNTQNRFTSNTAQIDAPAEDPVRQREGVQHHDLYGSGQYGERSDLCRAEILCQQRRQVLRGQESQPDLVRVQYDRTVAGQAAHREITAAIRRKKEGPAGKTAGLFTSAWAAADPARTTCWRAPVRHPSLPAHHRRASTPHPPWSRRRRKRWRTCRHRHDRRNDIVASCGKLATHAFRKSALDFGL